MEDTEHFYVKCAGESFGTTTSTGRLAHWETVEERKITKAMKKWKNECEDDAMELFGRESLNDAENAKILTRKPTLVAGTGGSGPRPRTTSRRATR